MSGTRLAGVTLVSHDVDRLAAFYAAAFGFARGADTAGAGERRLTLHLGAQTLDLLGFASPGAPYPADVPGWHPAFQHVALVVSDMAAAMARLSAQTGWRPISTAGPQILPAASGGVTAFKFRDPEGHPLEFLAFEADAVPPVWRSSAGATPCLGYDHSAISVRDTSQSVAFYRDLGLATTASSLNSGIEQARLDDVADPHVEVTALTPGGQATPHVELLCYRGAYARDAYVVQPNDVAASRLCLALDDAAVVADRLLRDPDGHLLELDRRPRERATSQV